MGKDKGCAYSNDELSRMVPHMLRRLSALESQVADMARVVSDMDDELRGQRDTVAECEESLHEVRDELGLASVYRDRAEYDE